MLRNNSYCAYCGKLCRRCNCHHPDSDVALFLARGGRSYEPLTLQRPPQWAVPPQVKRRERRLLRQRYREWYERLTRSYGEYCANCDERQNLVLDHVIPIAKGGLSRLDNLQVLCSTCNRIKGKLLIDCRPFIHPE